MLRKTVRSLKVPTGDFIAALRFANANLEGRIMWNELGISGGTAIVILIALYFVIKWAVRNGIKEAYRAITGEKTDEDIQNEEELKELGLDSEDQ